MSDIEESEDGDLSSAVFHELMEPLLETFAQRLPKVTHLAHYCNAAALEGIVNSREFWFNPISLMTDTSELVAGKNMIFAAGEGPGRAAKAMYVLDHWVADFWERARDDFGKRLVSDRENTFIACWSECNPTLETHDDLAMWRGYSDDGDGFALVVPALELVSIRRPRSIVALPVEYESEAQFKARAANYFQTFAINFLNLDEEIRADYADVAVRAFSDLCLYLAASHKHVGFAGEKEWRLVWTHEPELDPELDPLVKSRGGVRRLCWPMDGLPSYDSYFRFRSISQVMVGPTENGPEKARAAEVLFRGVGCTPLITQSRIPYRGKRIKR